MHKRGRGSVDFNSAGKQVNNFTDELGNEVMQGGRFKGATIDKKSSAVKMRPKVLETWINETL